MQELAERELREFLKMHTMTSLNRLSAILTRTAALGVFAASAALGLQAQQSVATVFHMNPAINLQSTLNAPLDLSAAESSSSSSLASVSDAASAEQYFGHSGDSSQPPPRRRYHRPNYSDRMHNPDGSSKVAINFGGGFNVPVSNARKVFTTSYDLQAGAGYNFNKRFGILAEFGYDHFGLQGAVIANQIAYYNQQGIVDPTTGQPADFSGLDGNAHVLSITLDPILTFYQGDTFGAYVIGGGGFYHKATNFTLPQSSYYCDYYYGCYPITQNANFDTHTANGGGLNVGGGLTFKPSHFGSIKLYTEARYVWSNAKLYTRSPTNPSPFSVLDNTSNSYIPVTFGVRW